MHTCPLATPKPARGRADHRPVCTQRIDWRAASIRVADLCVCAGPPDVIVKAVQRSSSVEDPPPGRETLPLMAVSSSAAFFLSVLRCRSADRT